MGGGEALARGMVRDVRAVSLIANFAGALSVFGILTFLDPSTDLGDPHTQISMAIFAIAMVAFVPLAIGLGYRIGKPVRDWLVADRAPTSEERRSALRQPLRQSMLSAAGWAAAAVMFVPLQFVFGNSALEVLRVAFGIALGGLVTCLLVYLLLERVMRPIVALALAGGAPEEAVALGIRNRLMLAWALASALPFVAIVMRLLIREGSTEEARPLLVGVAAVGIFVGGFTMAVVTRSISEPLTAVRHALERVREGDLDVAVDVDDAGEMGLLQAGVNRMTEGLRERREIEELFGRHVGAEVARAALERGSVLGGEQREVSVFFVDIIGSTAMAQRMQAADVVRTLNAMFAAVAEVVESEGGVVNKFEGDGALCVFGAPNDLAAHQARALRATCILKARLDALTGEHPGLVTAIGVSSGPVVAGNVGAPNRFEYTIIGDPVNEAARLTDAAKGRESRLLASAQIVDGAGSEAADWVPADTFELRGRSEPTKAYEPAPDAS